AHPVGEAERGGIGVRHPDVLGLRAVDLVAEDPAAAFQALPVAYLPAVPAAPAGADAGDQRAIARAETAHAVADLLNGSHGLVAQDPAVADRGHVPLEDVQVGAADGDRLDPYDDVAIVGDLRIRCFFPGLLTGTVVDEGSHALPPPALARCLRVPAWPAKP